MKKENISLISLITNWALIIGAIAYSHIVYFPAYLHNLPESNNLLSGEYAIIDSSFWPKTYPLLMVTLIISIIFNWKIKQRRNLILIASGICILSLLVTLLYFVPELMTFAEGINSQLSSDELTNRASNWEKLSWIRGFFMLIGFLLLLIALTKNKLENKG